MVPERLAEKDTDAGFRNCMEGLPLVKRVTHPGSHGIDYVDNSGALTRIFTHQVEQDTFTANGQTLVGDPFTAEFQLLFDSGGSVIHAYGTGLFETIRLPDGSRFISAARADFTQHPGVGFLLSPDRGNPGNLAGFCAALSP